MNNFWTLVRFEYKKIFRKKSVLIALSLAWILTIFSCLTMVIGMSSLSKGNGENMTAYEVMLMDKSYEKALEGRPLDGNLILEASAAYQKIEATTGRYTDTPSYQKYARPYSSIYAIIDAAYVRPGKAFNVTDFQNISEEDAHNYYAFRSNQYRANITNNPLFSASDVEKIMAMDEDVEKPFIMAYKDGYQRFFALSTSTIIILLFMISFCISPIFSDEYAKGTAALILTSKNGRKSFIYAKLFAAISLAFILALCLILSTYLTCILTYGFDGANAQIQLLIPAITYNFTIGETAILLIITSLLGAILHAAACTVMSTLFKSSIIPMAISAMFILPLNISFSPFLVKLRHFFPILMGSYSYVTTQFVFDVFGKQIMLYQMVCIVALGLTIVFLTLAFRRFKNHQIS